ncbi:amidohydrolase [Nakamurella multipartita]|uniref:Amidohydrolase 3 n=1 Tax=Nakamurella multipartita (strain ATCC 700099 / DSM 44233 / CIP 104796 / JCM 9543 / NBRC 105858 / Y-104) TaxID=479431 RepID=C8XFR1_NAKMY|nr:amidohydrolase [Nakamurella multipartita]ACV78022.1 Amidohydrolase 3 [Nakamurella multipartita DSM 44233]
MNPDLIVTADTVHTLDPSRPAATAVAITGGTITAVGDRSQVTAWRGTGTRVIELGAATVTPGLVDGHIHPVLGLDLTRGADLSAVRDLDELTAALRRAQRDEPGEWVLGWGLNPNAFGRTPLTHEPLVRAVGDIPVLVLMFDAHAAIASPAALKRAGIDGPREFAGGATIVCDEHGVPTGHLLEIPAYELVQAVVPEQSRSVRRQRFRDLLQRMAAAGLTAGNAMDFEADSAELVTHLDGSDNDAGGLPLRLRFAPFCMPGVTRAELDELVDRQRSGGARWRVDGVKFMIDGTVDGGTAWLSHADTHGESTAPFWPDPAEYVWAARYLADRGVPVVTHAIGDAGVRYVLDALSGTRRGRVPHRIEHIETIPTELVGRFRALDVTASMQPTHCTLYTSADQSDNWSQRLGPDRARRAFRCRDLADAGARLALGSDWPVAPFDPRGVIADAQLRRPHGRGDADPVQPGQALTAAQALRGYTTAAAEAAGLGQVSGRIAVGLRADLSAFGLDPLIAAPDEFAQAPVPLTVVDGTVVHRAD